MLTDNEYIRSSLENNLYYAKLITELNLILENSIPINRENYKKIFKKESDKYNKIFHKIYSIANYNVSEEYLKSNILVTAVTKIMEEMTINVFNIPIDTSLTDLCLSLKSGTIIVNKELLEAVTNLNKEMLELFNETMKYLIKLDYDFSNEKITIYVSDLFVKQFINKIEGYKYTVERLLKKSSPTPTHVYSQNYGLVDNMLSQGKFIKRRIDPTPINYVDTLNHYIKLYSDLIDKFDNDVSPYKIDDLTSESKAITTGFKNYNISLIAKILEEYNSYSVIPLLYDHILRESNFLIKSLNYYLKGE